MSAAHPDENARASRKTSAAVVMASPYPGAGSIVNEALSTSGRSPAASWNRPNPHMPRIAIMKA